MPTVSFVPWEAVSPLPNAPQEGEQSLPCHPEDPKTACLLPSLCPPSPQEHHKAWQAWSPQWHEPPKLPTLSSTALKNMIISPSPFPCQWFWRSIFHVQSLCTAFSFSPLPPPPSMLSSLPFRAPTNLFPPKSTPCSSSLPQCGYFSPSICEVCSLSPQIEFLGVQNNLILI